MRIAVLGSGGIGGYYGARLLNAGHDVSFIARGAHFEAMQQHGLTVRTPEAKSTIAVVATGDHAQVGPVDLFLYAERFSRQAKTLDIDEVMIAPRRGITPVPSG
jgi:2-dehydropantoate 2-reductase